MQSLPLPPQVNGRLDNLDHHDDCAGLDAIHIGTHLDHTRQFAESLLQFLFLLLRDAHGGRCLEQFAQSNQDLAGNAGDRAPVLRLDGNRQLLLS